MPVRGKSPFMARRPGQRYSAERPDNRNTDTYRRYPLYGGRQVSVRSWELPCRCETETDKAGKVSLLWALEDGTKHEGLAAVNEVKTM